MIYIKKFELLDWRNIDYDNNDEYKNTFIVNDDMVFLVDNLTVDTNLNWNMQYAIEGYSFEYVDDIFDIGLKKILYRSKEELGGVIFLNPNEFYEQYPELCYNLYLRLNKDNTNLHKWKSHFKILIRHTLLILNTIEDLKFKIEAEEYNL